VTIAVLGALVLVLVLIAAVAPLALLAGQPVLTQLLQSYPDVVPLAAVGLIVAWRRPANPIGWLVLVTAVLFITVILAGGLIFFIGRYTMTDSLYLPLGSPARRPKMSVAVASIEQRIKTRSSP
jgi:hypothetical protein